MTGHLDDASLRAFVSGALDPAALLAADDHLAECGVCRARAAALPGASPAIDTFTLAADSTHLTDDEVQAAASGTNQAPGIRAHLDRCAACRDQVTTLRDWAAARPDGRSAARGRPRAWLLLAASALAAVTLAWWLAFRPSPPGIAGLDMLSAPERARIEAILAGGRVALPRVLDELEGGREVLMGEARRGSFAPLSPLGTVDESDRPTFAWTPLAGARSYRVVIVDAALVPVAESPALDALRWTPPAPLPRGRTYTWQVTADTPGGSRSTPAPPAPAARFHVVDGATVARLDAVRKGAPDAFLVLGLLSAEAGLLDDAVYYLEFVPPGSAHAALARETRAAVDARRLPKAAASPQ